MNIKMEFKKISIDQETFEEINKAVWGAYRNAEESTYKDDMKLALAKIIFEVQKPYIEGEWNDCGTIPPSHYDLEDVLIRRKDMSKYGERKHTCAIKNYKLAYFRASDNKFVDEDGCNVLRSEEVSDFEYKFIE